MEEGENDADKDGVNSASRDVKNCTIAQSCRTLIPNQVHLDKIQDAVQRMNKIRMLAGELLCLHIRRCLDHSIVLPCFTQVWCKQLFKEVSHVEKPRDTTETDDAELTQTAMMMENEHSMIKPSRSHLSQLLNSEANSLVTTITTNIKRHFRTRVQRFVRHTFGSTHTLPKCEHMKLKIELLKVSMDVCREQNIPYSSSECYHEWIEEHRRLFGLDVILQESTLAHALESRPHLFLKAMDLMNRTLEEAEMRTFSLLPLKRKFRPGFIELDCITWKEILSLPETESRKTQLKETAQ